ncbi:MAG: hypothetical protein IJE62_02945 [Clostridia bacterium]|nr:hypothetical protein [Clostridia bacterium]MBR3994863.1 hypothetical protein [Clostridia bacterium]MBR6646336.1 hypothetical protein [Clostridia bacterium]
MAMSTNNFLENELRKIFGNDDMFSNTKYISGVCYGELDSDLKIKCQIDDSGVSRNYDVLRITVINRKDGVVDKHAIQFFDVWGRLPVPGNPNFKEGVAPHIWAYDGKTEWYAAAPKERHYEILKENVKNYLDIFRDKSIELEPKPSIKKQLSDNKNISTQKKPAKSKNNDLEV